MNNYLNRNYRKCLKVALTFLLILLLTNIILSVNAHPGSLDNNGGHYNRSTGEYHYHEGTHTENNSDAISYSDKHVTNKTNTKNSFFDIILKILVLIIAVPYFLSLCFGLFSLLFDSIHKKFMNKTKYPKHYSFSEIKFSVNTLIILIILLLILNIVQFIIGFNIRNELSAYKTGQYYVDDAGDTMQRW